MEPKIKIELAPEVIEFFETHSSKWIDKNGNEYYRFPYFIQKIENEYSIITTGHSFMWKAILTEDKEIKEIISHNLNKL